MNNFLYTYKKKQYTENLISISPLYEDDYIAVFNKPRGIIVHSDGSNSISMQDLVDNYYCVGNSCLLTQPIHRLDKETRGLIIYSKSKKSQPIFDRMIQKKEIDREYLAIVSGVIKKGKTFLYSDPIGKNRYESKKMVITMNGKKSLTHVCSLGTDGKYSILKCKLETGRTHQIRVHLSYHGMPIVNDALYGSIDSCKEIDGLGLISYRLKFIHPYIGEMIEINCELESTIQSILNRIN